MSWLVVIFDRQIFTTHDTQNLADRTQKRLKTEPIKVRIFRRLLFINQVSPTDPLNVDKQLGQSVKLSHVVDGPVTDKCRLAVA